MGIRSTYLKAKPKFFAARTYVQDREREVESNPALTG